MNDTRFRAAMHQRDTRQAPRQHSVQMAARSAAASSSHKFRSTISKPVRIPVRRGTIVADVRPRPVRFTTAPPTEKRSFPAPSALSPTTMSRIDPAGGQRIPPSVRARTGPARPRDGGVGVREPGHRLWQVRSGSLQRAACAYPARCGNGFQLVLVRKKTRKPTASSLAA